MKEINATDGIIDFILDNLKNIFYPEEFLALDQKLAKSELMALLVLDRSGELSMGQLADKLHMPVNTTTGLAERLVEAGYLERERSGTDRRLVLIKLTAAGRELTAGLKKTVETYVQYIGGVLTEEEKSTLLTVFYKILEALKKKETAQSRPADASVLKKIEIE